jgi:hypothetical protein
LEIDHLLRSTVNDEKCAWRFHSRLDGYLFLAHDFFPVEIAVGNIATQWGSANLARIGVNRNQILRFFARESKF